MRNNDFQRLARVYLLPHLAGFQCSRYLIFADPIGDLLQAFCFERSGFDANALYMWVFVQPLYVPTEHVYFTFGNRLSSQTGRSGWTITAQTEAEVMADILDSVRRTGLPFLDTVKTPADLLEHAKYLPRLVTDPHMVEAFAYSLILIGEHDAAIAQLHRLHDICEAVDPLIEWPRDLMRRGDRVLNTLQQSPTAAQALLDEWRAYTLHALKLEKFAAPSPD